MTSDRAGPLLPSPFFDLAVGGSADLREEDRAARSRIFSTISSRRSAGISLASSGAERTRGLSGEDASRAAAIFVVALLLSGHPGFERSVSVTCWRREPRASATSASPARPAPEAMSSI